MTSVWLLWIAHLEYSAVTLIGNANRLRHSYIKDIIKDSDTILRLPLSFFL